MTDKRYQVFISATYLDLREEREALLQVLPALGCLPVVVEAHGQNLTTMVNIRRRIDESDYFVLLVGSRYGSLMPSGVSYTHMEYVYAATKKKPTVILMHESPETRSADLQEQNISGKLKLSDFRKLLIREQPDNIFYWRDKTDLTTALRSMIPALIRCHPSLGWVRVGNSAASAELEKQCDVLKKRIQELEQEREIGRASCRERV